MTQFSNYGGSFSSEQEMKDWEAVQEQILINMEAQEAKDAAFRRTFNATDDIVASIDAGEAAADAVFAAHRK